MILLILPKAHIPLHIRNNPIRLKSTTALQFLIYFVFHPLRESLKYLLKHSNLHKFPTSLSLCLCNLVTKIRNDPIFKSLDRFRGTIRRLYWCEFLPYEGHFINRLEIVVQNQQCVPLLCLLKRTYKK